jgi:predicted small lipoprotein YifL
MKKWLPYILIILLVLDLTACGKKGAPVPPADKEEQEKQESSYP